MVAFRQPKNSSLRSRLVKTKLPTRNQRTLPGLKKCQKPRWSTCKHISEGKQVRSANNKKVIINLLDPVTCESSNVVYCVSCDKPACKFVEYIGETGGRLFERAKDYHGRDKHSLVHKHSVECNHKEVDLNEIKFCL